MWDIKWRLGEFQSVRFLTPRRQWDQERQVMEKQIMPWWVFPAIFYVVHFFSVLVFASGNAHLTGPKADAGGMVWIAWYIIDFPIGIIGVSIGEEFSTNWIGVLAVALIGGIQWIIWGLCLAAIIRGFQKRNKA
jgi:hypothetical protein